jgi:septum formation protein
VAGQRPFPLTLALPCRGVTRLVLASASPARRRLLQDAGLRFDVVPSDVDESVPAAPDTESLVRLLARAKARRVAERLGDDGLVLGCDSLLELDGESYGKPASAPEARRRWARMAGRQGILHTGHCLVEVHAGEPVRETVAVASTVVHFGRPDAEEVSAYVSSGEPLNVAGAFTLDGLGGWFVERIDGDHGTVVGLSLPLLRRMLREHGVRVSDLWATPVT